MLPYEKSAESVVEKMGMVVSRVWWPVRWRSSGVINLRGRGCCVASHVLFLHLAPDPACRVKVPTTLILYSDETTTILFLHYSVSLTFFPVFFFFTIDTN